MIASLVVTASRERIALGGGIACARPWLVERSRQAVLLSLGGYLNDLPRDIDMIVDLAALGDRAGPLGAIAVGDAAREARLAR